MWPCVCTLLFGDHWKFGNTKSHAASAVTEWFVLPPSGIRHQRDGARNRTTRALQQLSKRPRGDWSPGYGGHSPTTEFACLPFCFASLSCCFLSVLSASLSWCIPCLSLAYPSCPLLSSRPMLLFRCYLSALLLSCSYRASLSLSPVFPPCCFFCCALSVAAFLPLSF